MSRSYTINREKYKKIKQLDHKQMENFLISMCNDAYKEGKKAGEKAAAKVKLSDIETAITAIKGIGVKKSAEIIMTISKLYEEGQEHAI